MIISPIDEREFPIFGQSYSDFDVEFPARSFMFFILNLNKNWKSSTNLPQTLCNENENVGPKLAYLNCTIKRRFLAMEYVLLNQLDLSTLCRRNNDQ